MANSSKKAEEAMAHIREAEKSLKTNLLKWKPDFEVAADEYNDAAKCYKAGRLLPQCRECLLKAAENYKIVRSFFAAAKCVEQAAHISKDLNEFETVASLSERAACLYRDHGVPDSAALALDKGAKMIEAQLPDKALRLYTFAVEVVMTEDRPRQAVEYQTKISRHLVKMKRYDDAVQSITKEMGFHQVSDNRPMMGRLVVGLVLVQLARGDTVAAQKAFRDWGASAEQDEVNTIASMIEGFEEDDGDLARRALDSPFIKHMDIEYAKLARDIPTPKTSKESKKASETFVNEFDVTGAGEEEELDLC